MNGISEPRPIGTLAYDALHTEAACATIIGFTVPSRPTSQFAPRSPTIKSGDPIHTIPSTASR